MYNYTYGNGIRPDGKIFSVEVDINLRTGRVYVTVTRPATGAKIGHNNACYDARLNTPRGQSLYRRGVKLMSVMAGIGNDENAPANPHDVDGPGHPCGPSLEQEQAEYDAHIEAQLASTGRW